MSLNKVINTEIIHKELEPSVISEKILRECIMEQGYKGEAGRLAREEPIRYDKILQIRLENINILKLNHLWILPNLIKLSLNFNRIEKIENLNVLVNLKELDLSFNFIEKIENIEQLVKLEVMTLYSNAITKLENLDALVNLIILSCGKNNINTLDGIERLRFLKKLRSLNLEDNPIAKDTDTPLRVYLASFLPQLKYYHYLCVNSNERDAGAEMFCRQLREVEEKEKDEIAERDRIKKSKADEMRLSNSFVEFLNEHQLFDSLFGEDGENALFEVGEEAQELKEKYRFEAHNLTQQIYALGLDKHHIRLTEIQEFKECVDEAKISAQKNGQSVIDTFLEQKLVFRNSVYDYQKKYKGIPAEPDQVINGVHVKLQELQTSFLELVDETWKTLMEIEIYLFERVKEANAAFGHAITDMMNEFIEQAQAFFVQLREAEYNFCDGMQETTTRYIAHKLSNQTEHTVPAELQECLQDKDAIVNLVAGMRDHHMFLIDSREDRLMTRGRGWVNELITNLHSDEIKRNRNKVMEINYFLDQQRDEFETLLQDIGKEDDDE